MTRHDAKEPRVQAGGLVTVAFLKARLDEGNDHLGIFMPLVVDVLGRFQTQSFATTDVQEALAATHGIAMPQDAVATLLKRATRKHYLLREIGRFRHDPHRELPRTNVAGEKAQIEQGQLRLGEALQTHAAKRGMTLESTDAALDMLVPSHKSIRMRKGPDPGLIRPRNVDVLGIGMGASLRVGRGVDELGGTRDVRADARHKARPLGSRPLAFLVTRSPRWRGDSYAARRV